MRNNVEEVNKKKQKLVIKKKGQFFGFVITGFVLLITGLLLLFLWYRPFVNWTKITVGDNCKIEILHLYENGNADLRYTFEFEGEEYKVKFHKATFHERGMVGIDKTRTDIIYINPENPLDAKLGMQGQPAAFWFCICFIGFGSLFIILNIFDCISKEPAKIEQKEANYEK